MKQIPEMYKFLIPNKAEQRETQQRLQEQMDREDERARENDRRVSMVYDAERIVKSYDEWKRGQTDEKQMTILDRIRQEYRHDTNYHFDKLDKLNDKFSGFFFVWFKDILENEIGELRAIDYDIKFKLIEGDHWVTVPLNKQTYDKMLKNCQDKSFIFNEIGPLMTFALSGSDKDVQLNTFSSIHINRRGDAQGINAPLRSRVQAPIEGGGADFRYICTSENEQLKEYLKRLEIGVENKNYSCFVYALLMAGIDKKICDKINLKCRTRYLPIKSLKYIIEEFNLNIEVKIYNGNTTEGAHVAVKPKGKNNIRLSVYKNHYFIHEETPFKDIDFNVKLRMNKEDPYYPLKLTSTRLLMLLFELNYMRDVKLKGLPPDIIEKEIYYLKFSNYNLRLPEIKNDFTFAQARDDIKLIPKYAFQEFQKELKGVYGISGVIKYFVQQAAHGARVLATPGIFKDVALLDINSLYPSILANLRIPKGTPREWNDKTDLSKCDYYILGLDITETHQCALYPYAKKGYKVMDRYDIEDQTEKCKMKYKILRGYVWDSGTISVKDFILNLYNMKRDSETPEMKNIYKLMLNSIFGKTLQKGNKTEVYKIFSDGSKFDDAVFKYQKRVKQIDYEKRELILEKPYDNSFNFGFIGTAILSLAKRKINRIFEYCENHHIKILYHHTDSLMIQASDLRFFVDKLTKRIGDFHIEKQSEEVIIIGRGQYYMGDTHYRSAGFSHSQIEASGCIREWFINKLHI
jgi:hypothetical protein